MNIVVTLDLNLHSGFPSVWRMFMNADTTGTIVIIAAIALNAGSHAGTGAPAGTPPHEPKMINTQKVKMPR